MLTVMDRTERRQDKKFTKKFPDFAKHLESTVKRERPPRLGSEAVGRGMGAKKFIAQIDPCPSPWGSSVNDSEWELIAIFVENRKTKLRYRL